MTDAFDIIAALEAERDSLRESATNMGNDPKWRDFAHYLQIVLDSLVIKLRQQVNGKPQISDEEWLTHPLTVELMDQEKRRAGELLRAQAEIAKLKK